MRNTHSNNDENTLPEGPINKRLLCSQKAAADTLGGISVRTISRMIERKELIGVPVGRRAMVLISSIDDWVAQQVRAQQRRSSPS